MIIHQIPVRNKLRNFVYLLADAKAKEAAVIDPLAYKECLKAADELGVQIKKVINTHHHHDHIGGNAKLISATAASLFAPQGAKIENVDYRFKVNDEIQVGRHSLKIMSTPGHTMNDICIYYAGDELEGEQGDISGGETNAPALFSGDILFNAGVGNCYNGGNPEILHDTVSQKFSHLPSNTRLFPGHDYIQNNLNFTLDREPDNVTAKELLSQFEQGLDAESFVTTLALEKEINVFMRLGSPRVQEKLKQDGYSFRNDKQVFVALRELRNQW